MKAVRFEEYGPPEVLRIAEVDEPHAGPGQVRIRVLAAAVNPFDCKVRAGLLAGGRTLEAPHGIGLEASGVVDELGEGVAGTAVGDAVFGVTAGPAAADWAVLRVWAPRPRSLSHVQAAGLPVASEAASRALRELGVGAGQVVLIHGAAGGVGQAAVQLARALGARVIGTAGERNHVLLEELGAEPTTYGEGLDERVAALAPGGVDAVLDAAGGQLDDLVAIAGSADRVLTLVDFDAAALGVRVSGQARYSAQGMAEVARLADQGRFTLRVARTFDLADAAEAHRLSESRRADGKIVIVPG